MGLKFDFCRHILESQFKRQFYSSIHILKHQVQIQHRKLNNEPAYTIFTTVKLPPFFRLMEFSTKFKIKIGWFIEYTYGCQLFKIAYS